METWFDPCFGPSSVSGLYDSWRSLLGILSLPFSVPKYLNTGQDTHEKKTPNVYQERLGVLTLPQRGMYRISLKYT